jgi:hypothetical protein
VFCAAGLATLVARRWNRVAGAVVAGVVGLVTLLVTVWPTFGVDVGGGLVLLPVFVVLVLGVLGARITWRRLFAAGAAGVLLVAVIGVLDWLRPPDQRSHLGAFVQSVLDGTGLETVVRKAGYALRSLSGGFPAWLSLAVLVAVVLALWGGRRLRAAWLLRAEEAWPLLRHVLVALLVAGVGGALVNDYGIRVVTIMLFAAVPLVGLVVLRTDEAAADRADDDGAPVADDLPAVEHARGTPGDPDGLGQRWTGPLGRPIPRTAWTVPRRRRALTARITSRYWAARWSWPLRSFDDGRWRRSHGTSTAT